MPEFHVDQEYLRKQHYLQGNNLEARVQPRERFSTYLRLLEGLA